MFNQETVDRVVERTLKGAPIATWPQEQAMAFVRALHPDGSRLGTENPRPTAEDRKVVAICRGLFGSMGIEVPAALVAIWRRLPPPTPDEARTADAVRDRLHAEALALLPPEAA